ncbi:MAG: 30S ribosomal protein S7 [Candidatus Pacebacteria bacterium]|nr:30S ribosomal protein S7 [Candidatus Paceibacterota bacterium]MDD5357275.1 30S ribosomal protein S7 [Candidatus Paceibacterota bacterium]
MRRKIKNRKVVGPDMVFNSPRVAKFTNYLMLSGEKSIARKVVADTFELLKEKAKVADPVEFLESALKNTTPLMEVRSRRVGGANYQVPREVRKERQQALSMKWIIEAARSKKGANMHKKLADEIIAAAKNEGEAVKKKENTHKMAEANKAFAHFTW